MKKIRILAIVLALLMLPIGVLASCRNGGTPSDDPNKTDDGGEEDIRTTDPASAVGRDNDGTKDGYLMFFNFDAAKNGNLPDMPPYSTYLTTVNKTGCVYVINPTGKLAEGQTKSGCLLIQRENSSVDGYVDLKLDSVGLLQSQHVIEFDVKLGDGIFGRGGAAVYGVKGGASQYFVRFRNNDVLDADGAVLYTCTSEEEWAHIAIAVDDAAGSYDLYVNGIKFSENMKYGSAYPTSSELKATNYRLSIAGGALTNEYFYVDNLAVSNGNRPSAVTGSNVVYKDSYTEKLSLVEASKAGLIRLFEQHSTWVGKVNATPYDGNLKLTESIGLYILKTDPVSKVVTEIPVFTEYYALMNTDFYGGAIGGYTFKNENVTYKFVSSADFKVLKGETEGTYEIVGGNADKCNVKVTFDEETVEYFVLDNGVLSVATCDDNGKFEVAEDAVTYEKDGERDLPDAKDVDGVLVPDYKVPALGENEQYAIRWTGYKTFDVNQLETPAGSIENFDPDKWSYAEFKYYIPEDGRNFRWTLLYDTGNGAPQSDGKTWSYFSYTIAPSQAARFDELVGNPSNLSKSRDANMSRFTGKITLAATGWSNGPTGRPDPVNYNEAFDGYSLYILDWSFIRESSVVVKGPAEDKKDCTHTDSEGASTLVELEEPVKATCKTGSYYVYECSVCGATKLVAEKGVGDPVGHDYSEPVVIPATCVEEGYTVKTCKDCGTQVISDKIPATGHVNYSAYDGQSGVMILTCTKCGEKSAFALSSEMMDADQKLAAAKANGNAYSFIVKEGQHDNYDIMLFDDTASANINEFEYNNKNCYFKSGMGSDGVYYAYFQRAPQGGKFDDCYFDVNPKNGLKAGANFVYEIDLKLGNKSSTAGLYPVINCYAMERDTATGANNVTLFTTTTEGGVRFGSETIELSDSKFTNIAIVFKTATACADVYVNGELTFSDIMIGTAGIDYTAMTVDDVRCSFIRDNNEPDASFYFNNVLCYNGDYPVCVIKVGGASASVSESTGAMEFVDAEGEAVTTVNAGEAPVKVDLKAGQLASKYVTSFKLTAANLADGALISGVKLDKYEFTHELVLFSVKGEYLYYLDTAICKVSDLAAGATIKLVCNDNANKVTVYVNDVVVPGGEISYPDGYYAEATSYLKSYIFAAGSYKVEDLTMTAGLGEE